MSGKYSKLKEKYPEYVSKGQLRVICKISLLSATYLIEHGIIPAIDTGKTTWRYKIHIDDVIKYLRRREQWGSQIPPGAASSRYRYKRVTNSRKSYADYIQSGEEPLISEYFLYLYEDFSDVLTVSDVIQMTGLSDKTLKIKLKEGHIQYITKRPRYTIPKMSVINYVSSKEYIEMKSNSELFKKILGGFEIWKSVRSSQ